MTDKNLQDKIDQYADEIHALITLLRTRVLELTDDEKPTWGNVGSLCHIAQSISNSIPQYGTEEMDKEQLVELGMKIIAKVK